LEINFTPAEHTHAELLVGLMREFCAYDRIPFDEPAVRAALAEFVGDHRLGGVWLIETGGDVAGYIVLTVGFSFEFKGRDAFVDELYLREEFRGRGFGGRALLFAEGAARTLGVRALHLEVDRSNERAQALYRRHGFRDHDRYLLTKWVDEETMK
jgi:ribosomal protein S18 acetylase RimI-like enzyme